MEVPNMSQVAVVAKYRSTGILVKRLLCVRRVSECGLLQSIVTVLLQRRRMLNLVLRCLQDPANRHHGPLRRL